MVHDVLLYVKRCSGASKQMTAICGVVMFRISPMGMVLLKSPRKDTLQSTFPIGLIQYILNLQEEDDLPTKDSMAAPKVSFIWRLHCSFKSVLYESSEDLFLAKLLQISFFLSSTQLQEKCQELTEQQKTSSGSQVPVTAS